MSSRFPDDPKNLYENLDPLKKLVLKVRGRVVVRRTWARIAERIYLVRCRYCGTLFFANSGSGVRCPRCGVHLS